MYFPTSGVDCPVWAPPLVAFVIAFLSAPAGVSGAFLLLPLQMTVFGFVTPAVTPTNLLYNIVATPGGVYRYIREQRMVWPLALSIAAGSLPGMLAGAFIRVKYLPDPRTAKLFVAIVLLYIGGRLLWDSRRESHGARLPAGSIVSTAGIRDGQLEFEFRGQRFSTGAAGLMALALVVGVIGGIYGVGGGAIIAPYTVAILHLPAHIVAGAALFGSLVTSAAGIGFFELLGKTHSAGGIPIGPDWALGLLLGAGGLAGSYCGARLQKRLPEKWIKLSLGALAIAVAALYTGEFFV